MVAKTSEGEPRLSFGESMKPKTKNSPSSYVWGVKNPKRAANQYNGYGVVRKKNVKKPS
tara:strand:- start:398 stop:574 length:177 start_codon:yes stop_codon:yes gene_type:complete